jgi:hypothetical protein
MVRTLPQSGRTQDSYAFDGGEIFVSVCVVISYRGCWITSFTLENLSLPAQLGRRVRVQRPRIF